MTSRFHTSAARIVGAALATTPFLLAPAHAQTPTSGVNVAGTVQYSTNPFLLETTDGGVARGQVSISPFVEERGPRSTLRVSANAAFSKYSRRYRDTIDLSSQVGYNRALTRQLSLSAGMAISSTIGGAYNTESIFAPPIDPDTGIDIPPPVADITLVGIQERTTSARGSASLSFVADSKNSMSLGYNASVLRFPTSIRRSEYSNLGQTVSYSRVINSRASAGASVSVARVNYFNTVLGDAVIISPSANGTLRLARQWTLSGGVGFSTTRITVVGGKFTSTDLSASLNACRTDTRTNFCLNAARATGASSFDGVRVSTSIGASYSYKLNPRDSISASGGYSKSDAPRRATIGPALSGSTSYLSASTTYSRRLSDKLSGQLTGGFTRSSFEGTRSNAYASIGINYNLGIR